MMNQLTTISLRRIRGMGIERSAAHWPKQDSRTWGPKARLQPWSLPLRATGTPRVSLGLSHKA